MAGVADSATTKNIEAKLTHVSGDGKFLFYTIVAISPQELVGAVSKDAVQGCSERGNSSRGGDDGGGPRGTRNDPAARNMSRHQCPSVWLVQVLAPLPRAGRQTVPG